MIKTKKDLRLYILADRIMNGKPEKRTVSERLKCLFIGGSIIEYLRAMRHYAYYTNTTHNALSLGTLLRGYWGYKYKKLAIKLGFTIGYNSLGYGVVIPHYGTIVVNGSARVGNFAVLHTCTCIAGKKEIGDFLYLATGSQITGNITLGDGVTVAAHSLVNHSAENRLLLAGAPAEIKRDDYPIWIERDSSVFKRRYERVMKIRKKMSQLNILGE
jgi:serine O-acetyltransferase